MFWLILVQIMPKTTFKSDKYGDDADKSSTSQNANVKIRRE